MYEINMAEIARRQYELDEANTSLAEQQQTRIAFKLELPEKLPLPEVMYSIWYSFSTLPLSGENR